MVAVEDDEAEAANIVSQVENRELERDDTLLKITLVVGGSSGADKVTVGAKMKGIPMMKSKRADAGAETLLTMVRLQVMMMPTWGRVWQRARKPSWEQLDQNESQKPKRRSDPGNRGSIFKGIEDCQQSLVKKTTKRTTNQKGDCKELEIPKDG